MCCFILGSLFLFHVIEDHDSLGAYHCVTLRCHGVNPRRSQSPEFHPHLPTQTDIQHHMTKPLSLLPSCCFHTRKDARYVIGIVSVATVKTELHTKILYNCTTTKKTTVCSACDRQVVFFRICDLETLRGSLSALSRPMFATKCSLESAQRDLQFLYS